MNAAINSPYGLTESCVAGLLSRGRSSNPRAECKLHPFAWENKLELQGETDPSWQETHAQTNLCWCRSGFPQCPCTQDSSLGSLCHS